jgi:hypothetical protein
LTPSTALTDDGWSGFVNRFSPDGGTYLGGYSSSPGENEGGLAAIETGQGGVEQGDQQLVIISDYNNNPDQTAGNRVEANTYRERSITAADVGQTLTFSFDAKRGNINSATDPKCIPGDPEVSPNLPCDSTALAFIKTLTAGFVTTNFITEDTTAILATWNRYSISLAIDAGLVGQFLQVGFSATASNFEPSGVFYDNIVVTTSPTP